MQPAPIPIGIAVVEHQGCYLVGLRGDDGPLPGCAEFPGGKCRPGESPPECARRECLEESGLDVTPQELLLERQFTYPHGRVHLHFWRCTPHPADVDAAGHRGFRWVPAAELRALHFPEANQPLLGLLTPPSA